MKNKKRNMIITIVIIILLLIIGSIFFLLNYGTEESALSVVEKKWITDNANNIVDVDVFNDIPVYGYNGKGIIFEFLDYFSEEYNINFNKISYYELDNSNQSKISFLILNDSDKLKNKDILFYEDNYVVLNKENNTYLNYDDIKKIGILETDKEDIEEYFGEKVEYIAYKDIEKMLEGYNKDEFEHAVLPNYEYMDVILKNKLNIVYHINDLEKKYILRTNDETVYNIFNKAYLNYIKENYIEDYSENFISTFFEATNTSDLDVKNYNAKAYKYGYVINMPYENYTNGEFVGTISNYLKDFEKKADVEIEVVRYDSIDDLKVALVSGEIDFALGNFDYDNMNMESYESNTLSTIDYLVISKKDKIINSIKGLNDETISIVLSSKLHKLCIDNDIETNKYANTDDLLRSLDDNSIALIDKETYLYYKDTKLQDYKIIYEGTLDNNYKFIMNDNNKTFNSLFSYYISTINYDIYKYAYNTNITLDKDYTMYKILIFIASLIIFMIATVLFINRKNVTNNIISKEDKLKFLDPMTSLKNRNYLNKNIYNWDDNVIFPQSIVALDVNNIKEVNDKLGREAGDEVIKKVASILINNQLENTDIIRSGGDEFLIYMVGYEEKKVVEYVRNLMKEMKKIPNSLGVEAGYSMILDEVKTVDDAINEAIIMMHKNKEKRNKG